MLSHISRNINGILKKPIKLAKIKEQIVYVLGKGSVKQALQVGIEPGTSLPSPRHFRTTYP